jgi:hypothetical protein
LLKEPVKLVRGRKISVREFIKYVANVAGGIHRSEAKLSEDVALQAAASDSTKLALR